MNDIQNLIDRQLGIVNSFSYDNVLKRLVVSSEESFYGLQGSGAAALEYDHDPPIFACRFAELAGREHILALANEDGRVAIQDTTSARAASRVQSFQCHNNAVFDLAWMPRHMNFVTVSGDHTACLWDASEGAPRRVLVFSSHTRSVKTASFRPGEWSVLATGARDGHVLVWDVRASCQPQVVLKPDNCLMNCHASSAPKTPGSHGKRARLDTQRAISITGLVFQDAATLLTCGECDGNIKAWDLRKNYNVYTREPLPKHAIPYCGSSAKNGYTGLVMDEARVRLYASCMDNVIYCFNAAAYGAMPERRYVGHENSTFYIKTGLSPDGRYLVSGSSDKMAYVWSVGCSRPVVRLAGHRAEVTCAAWRRAGTPTLVTCSDDARHMLWRLGPELDRDERELEGRAEVVPCAPPATPPLGTPVSIKRRAPPSPTSAAKRARRAGPKRCLAELLEASQPKRPRTEPAACKRRHESDDASDACKRRHEIGDAPADWGYLPEPGTSFMTPTKNFEKRSCKIISPKSPEGAAPPVTFGTPTKDLPDFVATGEAPHLRLMSPARKRPGAPDWLTRLARGRSALPSAPALAPLSPRENLPPRRNSFTDKTPKSNKKCRTILKYFSVSSKDKND